MKIIAIEKELPGSTESDFAPHSRDEAARVWELYRAGVVREVYFRADRTEAVMVLECADLTEARQTLSSLPFVIHKLIDFELIPLAPYPGFERLFAR